MADAVPNETTAAISARAEAGGARAAGCGARARAVARRGAARRRARSSRQLRSDARAAKAASCPALGNPQRLFFAPLEPFLVDDAPERKHRGRIARACLDPIWKWICRDLMPRGSQDLCRSGQTCCSARTRRTAPNRSRARSRIWPSSACAKRSTRRKGDDKARRRVAGQIGTPHAIEDVREIAAILRVARRARRDRVAPAADHQQSRRRAARKRQGAARFADRPPSRRLSLRAADGDEPARLAVAADPPRHPCGRRAMSRRASPRRRSRSRSTSCWPTSSA